MIDYQRFSQGRSHSLKFSVSHSGRAALFSPFQMGSPVGRDFRNRQRSERNVVQGTVADNYQAFLFQKRGDRRDEYLAKVRRRIRVFHLRTVETRLPLLKSFSNYLTVAFCQEFVETARCRLNLGAFRQLEALNRRARYHP
jgi:hypothetical protein